jgi:hypothetical protein
MEFESENVNFVQQIPQCAHSLMEVNRCELAPQKSTALERVGTRVCDRQSTAAAVDVKFSAWSKESAFNHHGVATREPASSEDSL